MTGTLHITDTGAGADSDAIVDLQSTTRGALIPRMTSTERDAIATPPEGLLIYNTTTDAVNYYTGAAWVAIGSSAGSAPADATYITQTANSGLSAEQALSSLATGLMQVTTATGVISSVTTSAGLAGLISDETGSGSLVFATSPTLTTSAVLSGSPFVFRPAADSTNALRITKTDGTTAVAIIDTTNNAVGWFGSSPVSSSGHFGNYNVTITSGSYNALNFAPIAAPGSASSAVISGGQMAAFSASGNAQNLTGSLRGMNASYVHQGTATLTAGFGVRVQNQNTSTGTVTSGYGLYVTTPVNSGGGTVTSAAAFTAEAQTAGSNNTYVLLGTGTIPSGSWGIYSTSANDNSLGGKLGLMGNFTPTEAFSLSGQAARTVWMERHTTSNTAGNNLTVQSGGATSAATDKSSGSLILATGLSTGNATPGVIRLQTNARSASSGTGDNAVVDSLRIGDSKVLTNNSATAVTNVTLASNTGAGGVMRYVIYVTDGTDFQIETGFVLYSAVNKGGAFTTTINEVSSQQALSSGTLATTWTITSANPAVITVNANSSLTPSTGYPRIKYSIDNLTDQAVAAA